MGNSTKIVNSSHRNIYVENVFLPLGVGKSTYTNQNNIMVEGEHFPLNLRSYSLTFKDLTVIYEKTKSELRVTTIKYGT